MSNDVGRRAVVIGGSIGGLTTALLLRDQGFGVDVFERTPSALGGRGGGFVLHADSTRWFSERSTQDLEALSTSTSWVQYVDSFDQLLHRERRQWSFTYWSTFWSALMSDLGDEHVTFGEYACGIDQDADGATVRFASGRTERADLVVFADGITSIGRSLLSPASTLTYAGYVGWRGTVPETQLSDAARSRLGTSVTYCVLDDQHVIVYPIPGPVGEDRLMNFVWYRNVAEGPELTEFRTDRVGFQASVSLHADRVQQRFVDEMRRDAARSLSPSIGEVIGATPDPYVQIVADVRTERMAVGRVALIGDAAFAPRPHAAAGAAKASADAWALAAALDQDGDVAAALAKWEPAQLALGNRLIDRVVAMGRRSQVEGTWTPGDPELLFGLYGPGH